jgi:hypothetical protein
MWIAIDTNIFFDDLRLKKSLDLLFRDIENVNFSLRIPEVVVLETLNIYKEQRQSKYDSLLSAVKWFSSQTSLDVNVEISDDELQADFEKYEHYFREKIKAFGEIVPLPSVTHQGLIDRALLRKKPFKFRKDEEVGGFRDTLIWETLLDLTARHGFESIAFITKNRSDFAESNNLHPHLLSDLGNRGIDPTTIMLFTTLETFIEEKLLPALQEVGDIRDAIASGTHPHIDLNAVTEQYIWDLIPGFEVDPECLPNYREDNLDLTLSRGADNYKVVMDDLVVKRLSQSEILITANYILDCELHVFVRHWETYHESFDEQGFFLSNQNWNETYALATIVLPFKVTLRYVYNEGNNEVTSADIVSAECLDANDD